MRLAATYRRGRALGLALIAGLAVAFALLAAVPPSEAQAATTYEFQPLRLVVHDIEDGWPDWYDEPRMYYGGQVWADVVRNGSTVEGWRIPTARFTGTGMQIDLKERDGGWYDNNHLGSAWIPAVADQEHRATFGAPGGWWYYELVYRVVQVS